MALSAWRRSDGEASEWSAAAAIPLRESSSDLILHQGDQRRDDERRAVEQERGELIPDRLPGAGRHHGEHVTARERGAHDVLLARAEGRVAEVAAKGVPGVDPLHSGHYSPNGWQCGPTRCRLRRSPMTADGPELRRPRLAAPTGAASPSSRTSTTARRRSSTRCSSSAGRSASDSTSTISSWTRASSRRSEASRSSPRTRRSTTTTSSSTSWTRRATGTSVPRSSAS